MWLKTMNALSVILTLIVALLGLIGALLSALLLFKGVKKSTLEKIEKTKNSNSIDKATQKALTQFR